MDEPIEDMLQVYAAAILRHRQHIDDGCDKRAWHVLACHLTERADWSANSSDEPVRDGRPMPWNPTLLDQSDR